MSEDRSQEAAAVRRRSRSLALSASFTGLVLAASACGSSDEERYYCGDGGGVIAVEDRCDGADHDGGPYLIYRGKYAEGLSPGQVLPVGGTSIRATDAGARNAAGIPARGGFGGGRAASSGGG